MTTNSRLWLRALGGELLLSGVLTLGLGVPAGVAQAAPARSDARAAAQLGPAERFEEFFSRFRQDSSFQVSRIRFPLPWYSQAEAGAHQLARATWQFEPFYTAQETVTQVFDNFAMRLADTDERVYALIGVASDIRQNFFFRRLGGRWFLVRVEDLSM